MRESDTFDTAGEGSYAAMNVPENTVYVLYGGMLYNQVQNEILGARLKEKRLEHGWKSDDPEAVKLWMYK